MCLTADRSVVKRQHEVTGFRCYGDGRCEVMLVRVTQSLAAADPSHFNG